MKSVSLTRRFERLWQGYERSLHRRPVLTQCTTSALLWSLGDVLAQRLVEQRRDLDTHRIAVTAGFGAAFMGPVGHYWYSWLDIAAARLFAARSPGFVLFKIIADSAIMGPAYVLAFYAWGCALIDRSGWEGFRDKVTKDFVPTYAAELAIWPLFQSFNFTRIPVAHQLLAVNTATLFDAMFLSWARNQDDWVGTMMGAIEDMKRMHLGQPAGVLPAAATVAAAAATSAPAPASASASV